MDRVLGLLGDYLNKGLVVYMDNYYNSVAMSTHLLRHDTGTCGTLRSKRGQPKEMEEATEKLRKPGECSAMTNGK